MPRTTKSEEVSFDVYSFFVEALFIRLQGMQKRELKAIVKRMVKMYATANFNADDPCVCLTLDQADVCLAIASLAQSHIDGETLIHSDMERLYREMEAKS